MSISARARHAWVKRRLAPLYNLHDFEAAARRYLPRAIFAYIAGAAEDGHSFQANRDAFDDYGFVPRVLVDVSRVDQTTTLLGLPMASPFGIAPMGLGALWAYRADVVLAEAARAAGIPMIMSGSSLIRMETLGGSGESTWFQAYLPAGREGIQALVSRVQAAGFTTLVITLDTPVATNPDNRRRAGFSSPLKPSLGLAWDGLSHPGWLFGTFLRTLARHGMPHFENNYASRGAPIFSPRVNRDISDRGHLNWDDLAFIRQHWPGRLVLKSVLHPADAARAKALGMDALIVSNHGGRQLDGALSPLRALPGIIAAVGDLPVMIDSGFRRGTDVLKALALGARFVFIGRPFAYAAAVGGAPGVTHAIDLMAAEIRRDMALLGITRLDQLHKDHLVALTALGERGLAQPIDPATCDPPTHHTPYRQPQRNEP
ncbi:alpha-hydroxy-acid oxidizing protein [Salinicola endophyticus]|uniref:Alpha-hydroxy-acid oxidizing protein n=1 Tax=Salinicola endophyticus TaxID=1949083 RepID=A0ABY8FH91_9GAMM|nr:alpha-hydroxy acid oxidase [Salinicola endophyticus]WFF42184.1 alpha-hydroxy-acid oxidizing protein [Salinicola endophyticus]